MDKKFSKVIILILSSMLAACAAPAESAVGGTSTTVPAEESSFPASDVNESAPDSVENSADDEDDTSVTDSDEIDPIAEYLSCEWCGPTEYGLTGGSASQWHIENSGAEYLLTFSIDGSAALERRYSGNDENEESWSGQWSAQGEIDRPTNITISLSREGGRNFESADAPMYISETYPVLISPSGEEMCIFSGENGILLPFMNDGDKFAELSLSY